ncbi:MAG: hypothetical protein ABW092_09680 [Candidatus Thiodiazotropha sp.]
MRKSGNEKDIFGFRESLLVKTDKLDDLDFHLQAFCHWISDGQFPDETAIAQEQQEIIKKSLLTYKEIAFLGFLMDRGLKEPELIKKFSEGLQRLQGRTLFIPDQPQSFEQDRISQLGIALGILSYQSNQDKEMQWLTNEVLKPGSDIHPKGSIERGFMSFILYISANDKLPLDINPLVLGILGSTGYSTPDDEQRTKIAQYILAPENWPNQSIDAVIALTVFDWLFEDQVTCLPNKATHEDVLSILENVSDAMRHWRWEEKAVTSNSQVAKWNISNEYHVQALLGLILEPIFHDLDDEEYLKSLGQKKPRADFAIPSLQLIIEVKFMRQGTQSAITKVIDEVAADASLYLRDDTPYEKMIVFIWDDSRSTDQHQELKNAINRIGGIEGTVILSRPGRMV